MADDNFSKLYQPPAGSQDKFKSKLSQVILQDQREARTLKITSGILALCLCCVTFLPSVKNSRSLQEATALLDIASPSPKPTTKISASSFEYPRSDPGIRLYWVVR